MVDDLPLKYQNLVLIIKESKEHHIQNSFKFFWMKIFHGRNI